MSEFSLIDRIRRRAASKRRDVALGIGDDAALLNCPAGQQLVACTDTMVAGVHFLCGTDPADLGWKSLAVNLSDLAAMGAEPAWALLALTLPEADPAFVDGFADGFSALARLHDVALVGGDTTQGPLAITVTALGWLPQDAALTRAGARVGDAVFVTGTLGDAAGALGLLRDANESHPPRRASRAFAFAPPFLRKGENELHPLPQEAGRRGAAGGCNLDEPENSQDVGAALLARMHRPEPRVVAGLALRGTANACIDVSDGLVADLGHVCEASGVGAEIEAQALPLSTALIATFDEPACRRFAFAGGDDYELCFTLPESGAGKMAKLAAELGLRMTRIGRIVPGGGVRVLDAKGNVIEMPRAGWEHFAR